MSVSELIYNVARSGSPFNPGLPDTLARLVVSQAQHETGNFTSNFFRSYNNAFGYSAIAGARYQSGAGSLADNGKPIAVYPSLENSVYEIIDWIYRRRNEGKFPALDTITTPDQYAALLKQSGYYGDTVVNYAAGLKRWFSQNPVKTSLAAVFIAASLVVIILQKG